LFDRTTRAHVRRGKKIDPRRATRPRTSRGPRMIRRLLLGPYKLAEPWVRHPSWMVRRPAQVAVLGIATIWLALPGGEKPGRDTAGRGEGGGGSSGTNG